MIGVLLGALQIVCYTHICRVPLSFVEYVHEGCFNVREDYSNEKICTIITQSYSDFFYRAEYLSINGWC
jgi:hypothetical protein